MQDRRRAPRIKTQLKLELRLPGQESAALGETLDLSSNGVYFQTPYYLEEGIRLPLRIYLRTPGEKAAPVITPSGVVVRCFPEQEDMSIDRYEAACFFLEISEQDQERLDAYLAALQNAT
jgi:hypothetical protein